MDTILSFWPQPLVSSPATLWLPNSVFLEQRRRDIQLDELARNHNTPYESERDAIYHQLSDIFSYGLAIYPTQL